MKTTNTPQIDHIREEVKILRPEWDLIRDCLAGERVVKAKLELYLPKPNPEDTSKENKLRYLDYVRRAVFYNVTKRTLDGLVGQIFMRDATLDLPALLAPLEDDIDGAGVSLDQQAKKTLSRVMAFGRCGLLTDYPATESDTTTRAQLLSGDIKPTIQFYEPWQIINWRTQWIGGRKRAILVVLQELAVSSDDGFKETYREQFRVLRLVDTNGTYAYVSEVWVRDASNRSVFVLVEQTTPLDATGGLMTEIPFVFVGWENNDAIPDPPLLADMARLNIAHYRNSADYEESCYIVGQPTPFFSGLTQHWVDNVLAGRIMLGSRAAVPLPEGGNAGLLQAEPNSMPFEAMQHKEKQMVALGAKLVEQQAVQRTATEAGFEEASEHSILVSAANNISDAYTACLTWAGLFTGAVVEVAAYQLNTDLDIAQMDAQERAVLIQEWQLRGITTEEYRHNLRRTGVATLDFPDYQAQLELEGPTIVPDDQNNNQ